MPTPFPGKMLGTFGRGELEDAYGGDGMAVLDCKGKVHLNQVYLCLEQDPRTHLPGAQVRTIDYLFLVAFVSAHRWLQIPSSLV